MRSDHNVRSKPAAAEGAAFALHFRRAYTAADQNPPKAHPHAF